MQWLGWDDGNFLGWVQWTSNCGAPSSGTQSNRDHLFDRRSYADDAHYMGGTLLTTAGLEWAFFLFSPTAFRRSALVGDSWRAMWLERLQNIPLFQEIGCSTNDAMRIGSTDRYARTTQRSNARLCGRWFDRWV